MSTSDEVRVVSTTGGEKGQKLARFDLIPVRPLELLAEHYGRGARKYTSKETISTSAAWSKMVQYCSCQNNSEPLLATQTVVTPREGFASLATLSNTLRRSELLATTAALPISMDSAASATTAPLSSATRSTQSASVVVTSASSTLTDPKNAPTISRISAVLAAQSESAPPPESARLLNLDCHGRTKSECLSSSLECAEFAEAPPHEPDSTSTMITPPALSVGCSADDATKDSVSSEMILKAWSAHSPTCAAYKYLRFNIDPDGSLICTNVGDRNWERGYSWSLSFGAMMRHAWAFWRGEDIDEETGSPHLVAVAWHAFAMLEFFERHKQFDDRPKKEVK